MKKLIMLIGALAIAAISTQAQTYSAQNVGLGLTAIAATGASNILATLDVRKQKDVAVQIDFKLSGSGTGNQTLVFERSVDGSTWTTLSADKSSVVIAATSGTVSTTVTNLPTYGCGWIRLATWTNADASRYVTNLTVKYAIKINAP